MPLYYHVFHNSKYKAQLINEFAAWQQNDHCVNRNTDLFSTPPFSVTIAA